MTVLGDNLFHLNFVGSFNDPTEKNKLFSLLSITENNIKEFPPHLLPREVLYNTKYFSHKLQKYDQNNA